MEEDKINRTIDYYNIKVSEIVSLMNSRNNLTIDEIIYNGEQLSILEYKITALEIAKEN